MRYQSSFTNHVIGVKIGHHCVFLYANNNHLLYPLSILCVHCATFSLVIGPPPQRKSMPGHMRLRLPSVWTKGMLPCDSLTASLVIFQLYFLRNHSLACFIFWKTLYVIGCGLALRMQSSSNQLERLMEMYAVLIQVRARQQPQVAAKQANTVLEKPSQ
jgi:hypothetical protein